jgi:FkbM family methyltransferase
MQTFRRWFYLFRRRAYLALRAATGSLPRSFAPHGVPVVIPRDADVEIRYLLARGRPYEQAEAELIRSHLAPGSNVIELGGCMGVVSALVRHRIGPDAHHIVVEASPALAAICGPNATRGVAEGATEMVVAAVDYSGAETVTFSQGHNAHVGHVAGPGEGGVTVPAVTLSALAERLPAGPFALICDIEGAELALFAAERPLLECISLIVLETHPGVYPRGEADLATLIAGIEAAGFTLQRQIGQVVCFSAERAA